jgi:hypothetical protein
LLHAIPTTSAFIYSDVIALNAASLTAAILTSFWAYGSRESDPSSRITPSLKQNSEGYYKQIRIGASRASSFCFDESKIMEGPKFNISSQDNTKISREVTELLEWALEVPNKFSHLAPWSSTLLRKTIDMWCNGCIIMTVANRQSFKAAGLQDSWSYSNYDQKCLSITTGFLDESELVLHQETRHQALSYLFVKPPYYRWCLSNSCAVWPKPYYTIQQ